MNADWVKRLQRSCLPVVALFVCLIILSGCKAQSFVSQNTYVDVNEHDETYTVTANSDIVKVTNRLSLKNAVLNLIQDGITEAVIHTDIYTDNMTESIGQVFREITNVSPVGCYAVDSLTYEYARVVNYYEIYLHITYRHTTEEINSIIYLNDSNSIRAELYQALKNYQTELVLNIGTYEDCDVQSMADDFFELYPGLVLCHPNVKVSEYPEGGAQRILEIKISHADSSEQCRLLVEEANDKMTSIVSKYSSIDQEKAVKLAYYQVCRCADYVLSSDAENPYADSIYGVLVGKCGTSFGFARTYQQLLLKLGINCTLVEGMLDGYSVTWCKVSIGDHVFYVDPGRAAETNNMTRYKMEPMELIEMGYQIG